MSIDDKRQLSNFIPDRLPEFVRVDHPTLVSFLSAYYEWLGLRRNEGKVLSPLEMHNIPDVDTTLDQFIDHFKSEYLFNFPESLAVNPDTGNGVDPKRLMKNIRQFYLAKGTEKSYEFLFRILYDTSVEFYYPKKDILRLSAGRWTQNNYLRISNSLGDAIYRAAGNNIVQRDAAGNILATARVVEVNVYQIGSFPVAELLISGRNGTFRTGNTGIDFNDGERDYHEVTVYSVVSSLAITNGGSDYELGDRVSFIAAAGDPGQQGSGTVAEVDGSGSIRKINIDDFGINYKVAPTISINSARGTGFAGNVTVGSLCQSAGYYANNDGRLSTNKVLQDNHYYQNWSYVLKTEAVVDQYREMVRRLVHPVGTAMFGSVLIKRCTKDNLNNSSALMSFEVPIIGHYTPYTFQTFDDLSLWFNTGITNFDVANQVYNDLLSLLTNDCWNATPASGNWNICQQFDFTQDGVISGTDLGEFVGIWGQGPEQPGYNPDFHDPIIREEGDGYAVIGNPISNNVDFIAATGNVLETPDFPGGDPFWIIYQHPNKKVERGYHIAKIWKSQISDFLEGGNGSPWPEWQYLKEGRSEDEINEWARPLRNQLQINTARLLVGGTCVTPLEDNVGMCIEKGRDVGGPTAMCVPCQCSGGCLQESSSDANPNEGPYACKCSVYDLDLPDSSGECPAEPLRNAPGNGPAKCQYFDSATNVLKSYCAWSCDICTQNGHDCVCTETDIYGNFVCDLTCCGQLEQTWTQTECSPNGSTEPNCNTQCYVPARLYDPNAPANELVIPETPCDCVAFGRDWNGNPFGSNCGGCELLACCRQCRLDIENGATGATHPACIGTIQTFGQQQYDWSQWKPSFRLVGCCTNPCNPDCGNYDSCLTGCTGYNKCNQTCVWFNWCDCDPGGQTCCTTNPCRPECIDPCITGCTVNGVSTGTCHPECAPCTIGCPNYNACTCVGPCDTGCTSFSWCNCDPTGATCCTEQPCRIDCLDPCATACTGYGPCHPDCPTFDVCACYGQCHPNCPDRVCNKVCGTYDECDPDCNPNADPNSPACCQGCNCGGGGVGIAIYKDPPSPGRPRQDPPYLTGQNNECFGVESPCEFGTMQIGAYDYKYALLEYNENSEFRKITARAFFNMPQGQVFSCREENIANLPIPKYIMVTPTHGSVVTNTEVPNFTFGDDYFYYRNMKVQFNILHEDSLQALRAAVTKVYLNNKLQTELRINRREVILNGVPNGRHTLKLEMWDHNGKFISGTQEIVIFAYQFTEPTPEPSTDQLAI
jgi:hypothetical protein